MKPKSNKIIYVFDMFGSLVESMPIGDISVKYFGGKSDTLRSYIARQGIYKKYYYFLETKEFIVKHKKAEFNNFIKSDESILSILCERL